MKEGFDAGQEAAISFGTFTLSKQVKKFMFSTFLHIYRNNNAFNIYVNANTV